MATRETKSTRRVRSKPRDASAIPVDADETLGVDATDATYDEILEVVQGLPSDGDIMVSRLPKEGGKRESLGELDLVSFSVNFLASRWGAGRYFLQFRAPNPDFGGRKTIVTAKVVVIGEGHLAIKPAGAVAVTPTPPQSTVQQAMDAGLLAMIGGMTKMIMQVAERPLTPAPAADTGMRDVLLELARMRSEDNKDMRALIEKLGSRREADPIELATKIMALQGGRSGVSEAKEMISMALEMAEMVGGKGKEEPDDLMTTAMKGFMGMLDKLSFAGRQQEALPPGQHIGEIPVQTQPTADTPAATTATPPSQPADMNVAMLGYLKSFVEQALKFAAAKRNPRVYAHVMADAMESYPVEIRRTATNMLAEVESAAENSPFTAEKKLVQHFPDMALYTPWFDDFFEELRLRLGIIKPDDDEDDEEADEHEAFDSTTPEKKTP